MIKSSVAAALAHLVSIQSALPSKRRPHRNQFMFKAPAKRAKLDPYTLLARHQGLTKLRHPVPLRNSALLVEIASHPPTRTTISARQDHVVLVKSADIFIETRK